MKHVKSITVPALAICVEGHPDLKASFRLFLANPIDAVMLHFNKDNAA